MLKARKVRYAAAFFNFSGAIPVTLFARSVWFTPANPGEKPNPLTAEADFVAPLRKTTSALACLRTAKSPPTIGHLRGLFAFASAGALPEITV